MSTLKEKFLAHPIWTVIVLGIALVIAVRFVSCAVR
jgi:hypothetical protein